MFGCAVFLYAEDVTPKNSTGESPDKYLMKEEGLGARYDVKVAQACLESLLGKDNGVDPETASFPSNYRLIPPIDANGKDAAAALLASCALTLGYQIAQFHCKDDQSFCYDSFGKISYNVQDYELNDTIKSVDGNIENLSYAKKRKYQDILQAGELDYINRIGKPEYLKNYNVFYQDIVMAFSTYIKKNNNIKEVWRQYWKIRMRTSQIIDGNLVDANSFELMIKKNVTKRSIILLHSGEKWMMIVGYYYDKNGMEVCLVDFSHLLPHEGSRYDTYAIWFHDTCKNLGSSAVITLNGTKKRKETTNYYLATGILEKEYFKITNVKNMIFDSYSIIEYPKIDVNLIKEELHK